MPAGATSDPSSLPLLWRQRESSAARRSIRARSLVTHPGVLTQQPTSVSATSKVAAHWRGVPRYFFDLYNDTVALDDEGKELSGLEAAKVSAVAETYEMIKASIDDYAKVDLDHRIEVRDESGTIVYVMHFEDVVTVRRGPKVLSRPSGSA
jgi:hypothetical protein